MGYRRRPLTLGVAVAPLVLLLAAGVAPAGEVSGRVVFRGEVPALPALEVRKDQEVCGTRLASDALVLAANRGVRFAVVSVDGVPEVAGATPSEVTLENRRCRFEPHVVALRVGAELAVANADAVLHNLRGWLDGRGVLNVVQPTQGQVSRRTIKRAGAMRLSCDTHVHMHGWVVAFEHPYFAVTDADGRFTIPDVPPGTWRLTVWHEGWRIVRVDEHGRPTYDPPRVVVRPVTVPAVGATITTVELSEEAGAR